MAVDVEKTVRENIDRTLHMSLATVRENKPWICELHFAYDDELNLYFISLEDKRHSQEIVRNANVAGSIIDNYAIDAQAPVGVYFEGAAVIVNDTNEIEKAAELLFARNKTDKQYVIDEACREKGHRVYKVSVNRWAVFGRFEEKHGTKHELEWNT